MSAVGEAITTSNALGLELGIAYKGVKITVFRSISILNSWRRAEEVFLSSTTSRRRYFVDPSRKIDMSRRNDSDGSGIGSFKTSSKANSTCGDI